MTCCISTMMKAKLKHDWLMHRERVRNIKSDVDHHSPAVHVTKLLNAPGTRLDSNNYTRILKVNFRLLVSINRLQRTQGYLDTFSALPAMTARSPGTINKRMKALERANEFLGQRILNQKCEVKTRLAAIPNMKRSAVKVRAGPPPEFQPPADILARYGGADVKWNLPPCPAAQQRFFRPRIFFQLHLKNLRPMGRLVIELHTLASPQVVLELVRLCAAGLADHIRFQHVFTSLWMGGDFLVGAGSAMHHKVEYDVRALDNAQAAGILSYPVRALREPRHTFFKFAVSFKPLAVLNGRRVAFGQVVGGLKVLECLTAYGTKNGKPKREIVVASCGVL